eukprot:Blabericola_migrator_1__13409@NODE_959_length_5893_cov_215_544113_g665_i0_p2_GENE_NODE_959_length_5893_cov_215_544113_g665_i0NODE_959_length_5893_cov_215_544113_g665_i0_p2_ORF_typecomplete_len261_score35_57DUF5534/PF17686_1/0_13_NODE_959_length_5893_cov_215_544113_g665_i0197979
MNTKSDARWGHPVRVAAGVINDILHCSIKCHAPLSEAPTPTSGSLSIRDSLEEDFPCPNPLGGALLPSPPPCTNKRLVSPSENRFNLLYNFRTRSGVSSLRSSAAFRDSVVMREESTGGDDESSPQIETRRERCEDTLSASLLLKSINKYIKRTEKQREENAQLLQVRRKTLGACVCLDCVCVCVSLLCGGCVDCVCATGEQRLQRSFGRDQLPNSSAHARHPSPRRLVSTTGRVKSAKARRVRYADGSATMHDACKEGV